jgi:hypothetical protein
MNLGLLTRRESWKLTFRGKLVVSGIVCSIVLLGRWETYPFLAVNHPVNAEVLIVEDWIPEVSLIQVAREFRRGHYRLALITRNVYTAEADYQYADCSSTTHDPSSTVAHLIADGVPCQFMGTLFYPAVERDRTYHAALAAKEWVQERSSSIKSLNIVTEGPHARRSWLLYRKAFENTAEIGVVPLRDPMYDPEHWWRTSEGVREVLGEAIAYTYASFFFFLSN